jgi:uncharacterized protein (TIGR03437 family)
MVRNLRSNRRGGRFYYSVLCSFLVLFVTQGLVKGAAAASRGEEPVIHSAIAKQYGSLSMHFEPHQAGFIGRAAAYQVHLGSTGATISLGSPAGGASTTLQLVTSSRSLQPNGEGDRGGRSHYIQGRDENQWRIGVPHFDRVIYRAVYPGVDWIFYGNGRRLEYDFVVEPGADPAAIAMRFDNAASVNVEGREIVADIAGERLALAAPKAFQRIGNTTISVDVDYALSESGAISFQLGDYDVAETLIIDPVVSYATYLGGAGADVVSDIAVDADGQAVIVGSTRSVDFPVGAGATQEMPAGGRCSGALVATRCFDAFIAKLSADGTRLVHATYFGGTGDDLATGVAVNRNSIVVSGTTWADDFPVTSGAFQTVSPLANDADAFALRFASDGTLRYATLLGGSDAEEGVGVAVDADDNAYVVGHTESEDFPTLNGLQPDNASDRLSGELDVFVTKLAPDGGRAIYSTYFGGSRNDRAGGIAVDRQGNAYITGSTGSPDFPVTDSPQNAVVQVPDAFLAKINPDGSKADYSTRLGGSEADAGQAVSVTNDGVATIVGSTISTDFPTTPGVIVPRIAQPTGFAARRNLAGDDWVFSTFLVGTAEDLAVEDSGDFYVSGTIGSSSPIFGGAEVPACLGSVLRKINSSATRLQFSGFQPGLGSVALGPMSDLFSASTQAGKRLKTTPGAFQPNATGQTDGYVIKLIPDEFDRASVTCVSHGASFAASAVAPGLIVSIFGSGLGPQAPAGLILESGVVATTVQETSVLFDGIPAPLLYVHWNQINAVVPYATEGKAMVRVEVRRAGVTSAEFELPVGVANPGLFTRNGVGRGLAAILNEDGTINATDNPAPKGSVVSFFGTGEGQTVPPGVDGLVTASATSIPRPKAGVVVELGDDTVPVEFAGSAPELVAGVMQINVRVPSDAASGLLPVRVTIGGRFTRQPLFVAVE